MLLDPRDPVERVFADCVTTYRERSKKYTHASWDDNFRYIAERMKSYHPDFSPADAASVLMYVKEARQDAASKSGRTDFADDSYRDSDIDDINYRVIRRALRDKDEGLDGEDLPAIAADDPSDEERIHESTGNAGPEGSGASEPS